MLPPCTIVLFGGTGDLAIKKLIPSLLSLDRKGVLAPQTRIVSIGRKEYTDEGIRKEYGRTCKGKEWSRFAQRITYHRLEFHDARAYDTLAALLAGYPQDRLFYLATPQSAFPLIITNLHRTGLARRGAASPWHRIAFEKPFGSDRVSAERLHLQISRLFTEEQVFRVDHYLGKTFVQELMILRFANPLFEYTWRGAYIDNVQIVVSETTGVDGRGSYYDHSGAVRDMVQNHLLQLLALVAMEPPKSLKPEDIRNAKARVLRRIGRPYLWQQRSDIVIGQYTGDGKRVRGYLDEADVDPKSTTETFAALRLEVKNRRWRGVPFYLKTGKALSSHGAKISITYKPGDWIKFANPQGKIDPNILGVRIQPNEGVKILFNIADDLGTGIVTPHVMDFTHDAHAGLNSPEAYETLFAECMEGDHTLFPRWDFVRESWRIADRIRKAMPPPVAYRAGSAGPAQADALLARDGRAWVSLDSREDAHHHAVGPARHRKRA